MPLGSLAPSLPFLARLKQIIVQATVQSERRHKVAVRAVWNRRRLQEGTEPGGIVAAREAQPDRPTEILHGAAVFADVADETDRSSQERQALVLDVLRSASNVRVDAADDCVWPGVPRGKDLGVEPAAVEAFLRRLASASQRRKPEEIGVEHIDAGQDQDHAAGRFE